MSQEDRTSSDSQDSSHASSSSNTDRTFKPYGFGQVFPSFSPRSSGAGDTDFDWTMAEEKILRDVAQWLSPADLRRARLVCKTWYGALATLTTKAAAPAESLVPQWKGQLEAMLHAFPCLQELTIGSRLSSVAAQQLGVLAAAKQLQVLNIPYAQALQDRSLLALQPLATNLRQLRINGASSLSRRSLLLLSVLANLELLELKNCGKISWLELQQAWKAACMAHEAQLAAEGGISNAGTHASSSGGGSSRFSSSGGGLGSKLGAWLPTGRLFRTSSPASNSIQSALAWQRSGTSSLFAKVHELARGTSSAAAVQVAQMGIGAVGNGRSSCGGSMPEAPARSLLYRKQKEDAAAASGSSLQPIEEPILEAHAFGSASSSCFPVRSSLLRMRATKSAVYADEDSPRPISMLSRVGSLVWHNSSAAAAGTGSSGINSFLSSGSSLAAQTSCVQAALLAYIAQEQQANTADDASTEFLPGPNSPIPRARKEASAAAKVDSSNAGPGGSSGGGSNRAPSSSKVRTAAGSSANNSSSAQQQPLQPAAQAPAAAPGGSAQDSNKPPALSVPEPAPPQYKPRRRTTGERALPAMPFTKLATLSFTCSEVMLKNPGPELAAVAALTSLTSLEISKCKLPDAVFAALQGLGRLRKLKLTGLWSMGDEGLQHVAQLSNLQSLALSEAMHVSAQGLRELSSLSSLTSLALGFTQDLGPGVQAPVINSLPLLQCVEIAAPCWGDLDCELLADACPSSTPQPPSSGAPGGSTTPTEAAAGEVPPAAAVPQMLWDLAGGSFSRTSSRTNSSRQMVPPAARGAGSSWTLRGSASFSSMRSRSFGSFSSFSVPAASQLRPAATPPAQPLLVLRLHGCRALTSKGMAALKQLSGLQTLVLEDCKEVRAAEVISQGLLPPKLVSLTLKNLPFGNVFSGCVSMPCCSTRLTKLELVSLEGAHEGQLRRLLSFFSNLSELSLSGCVDLGDSVLQHVGLLPKLEKLSLGGCSIVGQGLEHLQVLPKLRVLSLKACTQLIDTGVGQLLSLPALEELDLSDCGGVSEQALLLVGEGAPQLVRMDVSGCKAVTRGLVAAFPHYLSIRHSL